MQLVCRQCLSGIACFYVLLALNLFWIMLCPVGFSAAGSGMTDLNDQTQSFIGLGAGTVVGRYRIVRHLGSGGMGDVYVADDCSLGRQVALKFLPSHLARSEPARQRFVREARAAAALNHPNIVQIFEVNDQFERPYLAMELVDGESLREVIHQRDMTIKEFLELAIQIASGLAEAHENGIVHRDIKPANILLDKKGRIRIVDFGLAQVTQTDQLTRPGTTVGTVGYFSPEQARGEKADARSDIFSLGIVLYELLTHKQPFRRDSDASTMQALLTIHPEPVARYKSDIHDTIQHVIDKCLAKNVEFRYQHADDLVADLKREREALSYPSHSSTTSLSAATRRWPLIAAAAAGLAVLAAVWFLNLGQDRGPAPVPKYRQITFDGDVKLVDISPDGTKLAYVRGTALDDERLYTYSLSGGDPLQVFAARYIADVDWAPDGNSVLTAGMDQTSAGVFVVPFMGGNSRYFPASICGPCRSNWKPNGKSFFHREACGNPQALLEFDIRTGADTIYMLDSPVRWVHSFECSPTGNHLIFEIGSDTGSGLWITQSNGSRFRKLTNLPPEYVTGYAAVNWSPDGKSLYYLTVDNESSNLVRQSVDAEAAAMKGEPKLLLSNFRPTGKFSVTRDGHALACVQEATTATLSLWSRTGGSSKPSYSRETVGTFTHGAGYPRFSPSGQRVAYVSYLNRKGTLYLFSVADRTTQRLNISDYDVINCAWSPDGRRLAVLYNKEQLVRLCLVDVQSGNVIPSPPSWDSLAPSDDITWTPSGVLLVQEQGKRNFYKLDIARGTCSKLITNDSVGWIHCPVPVDSTRLAVLWARDKGGVWVLSLGGTGQAPVRAGSHNYGTPVAWSASEGLFIVRWEPGRDSYLLSVSAGGEKVDTLLNLGIGTREKVAVSPDAKFVFSIAVDSKQDVMLVENFDPDIK